MACHHRTVSSGGSIGSRTISTAVAVLTHRWCRSCGTRLLYRAGVGMFGGFTFLYHVPQHRGVPYVATCCNMLHQAHAACKPGGFILYSTCTLTAEENEENVDW